MDGNHCRAHDLPEPCAYCCEDTITLLKAERVEALAACAEMRAALEEVYEIHQRVECAAPPCTCTGFEATRAALSRPDLGRGWASPEVVARARDAVLRYHSVAVNESALLADLDALLKKGGG